jgi:anaerobic magnesium-protoporphyrin IX monomethyl ester cyclase
MDTNVLLIAPPQNTRYPQPPLGLAMLAAVLEANSYSVRILDLGVENQANATLLSTIERTRPNIVGITAVTPIVNLAANVARIVKRVRSDATVILGGAHASILPEDTLRDIPEVDIIVRGEGEQTIIQLVKAINDKDNKSKILGLTYREGKEIRSTPPRPLIPDLDQLPFPAFHLLPMNKYRLHPPFGRQSPSVPIISSRGCPYRCIYCSKSVYGRKLRTNTARYVVNEIEYLVEKYHAKEVKFYDDVFTIDRNRVIKICDGLKKRGIDIQWTSETRVNLVDKKLLETMRDSGCYMVEYGVESGSRQILNNLKKDITPEQVVRAFELTHNVGIQTVAYFMLGSPGDTPETIRKTIDFAKKLDPDFVTFSISTPYPGTELYDLVAKEGRLPRRWNEFIYHWPGVSKSGGEELRRWLRRAHLSFYLRRHYFWKRLRRMRSLGEIRTNIAGLHMLVDFLK